MEAIVLSLGVATGVLTFFIGFRPPAAPPTNVADLLRVPDSSTLYRAEMSQRFSDRVLIPLMRTLTRKAVRYVPGNVERIEHRIASAGLRTSVGDFLAYTVVAATGTAALLAFLLPGMSESFPWWLAAALGALVGYYLPSLYLSQITKKRQKLIRLALPEFLDLLAICMVAGDNFEAAMRRTVTLREGPLRDEIADTLLLIASGSPPESVWQQAAERIDVDAVSEFVSNYLQATRQGAPMSRVLEQQSQMLRENRMLKAEAAANTAGTKMMIPAIGCFVPALILLIVVPLLVGGFMSSGFAL